MNEELRAELLERADRDRAARNSLPPDGTWEETVPPAAGSRGRLRRRQPHDVAYLRDRVLMFRGEPQIYGTQYIVRNGVPELWTVRDPEGLDERRAAPTAQRCR